MSSVATGIRRCPRCPCAQPSSAGWSCLGEEGQWGCRKAGVWEGFLGEVLCSLGSGGRSPGRRWRVGEVEEGVLQTPEPPEGMGSGPLLLRGDGTSDGPRVQLCFLS